jgi:hypothetical protein
MCVACMYINICKRNETKLLRGSLSQKLKCGHRQACLENADRDRPWLHLMVHFSGNDGEHVLMTFPGS